MAKSAQIGLHAWLPDAMEGPTPVSSLLHSATMVTAGIYLMLRLSVLFQFCPRLNLLVALIGGLTCLLGASVALFQEDIKKIIAYSTCSQLGLLMVALGIGNYVGCFFHLITHAFFKALLFLTAGCVIHALLDEQDIRKMGGLLKYMPYSSFCMLVGILGLVGFPYLSGFYSKEFILLFSLANRSIIYNYIFQYIFIGGIFTICYSLKLFFFLFLSSYRGSRTILQFTSDTGTLTCLALFILVSLTMFSGFILHGFFLSFNDFLWYGVLTIPENAEDLFVEAEVSHEFNKNGLTYFFLLILRMFFKRWKSFMTHRLALYEKANLYNCFYNFLIIFFYFSWNFHFFFAHLNKLFISISNNLIVDVMSLFEYIFFIYVNYLLKSLSRFLSGHFNILNFYKSFTCIFSLTLLVVAFNFVLIQDLIFLLIILSMSAEYFNKKQTGKMTSSDLEMEKVPLFRKRKD
jgi:NADH:ubiquinone oxidoreductase subunit 5 (subunit L)/multisubunit Na+/H+ antiporter MnhA subunit